MFEKATKAVKEVGGTVFDSAKNIGTSIYSLSKEQSELAGMKVQKSVIEKKLQESYAEIGKRYVEYIAKVDVEEAFDVSDIIEAMQPDLDKLEEIAEAVAQREVNAKKEEEEKQLKKAQDAYDVEKAKLDKALEMDIISQEEYNEKMIMVQKKFEHYVQIRKIDMQLQMGIISNDEYAMKIDNILR